MAKGARIVLVVVLGLVLGRSELRFEDEDDEDDGRSVSHDKLR